MTAEPVIAPVPGLPVGRGLDEIRADLALRERYGDGSVTLIELNQAVARLAKDVPSLLAVVEARDTEIERLIGERDAAREDCGHQRAMKESIRHELDVFIRLKMGLDQDVERLRAERDFALQGRNAWQAEAERDAAELAAVRGVAQAVEATIKTAENTVFGDQAEGAWHVIDRVRAALAVPADPGARCVTLGHEAIAATVHGTLWEGETADDGMRAAYCGECAADLIAAAVFTPDALLAVPADQPATTDSTSSIVEQHRAAASTAEPYHWRCPGPTPDQPATEG